MASMDMKLRAISSLEHKDFIGIPDLEILPNSLCVTFTDDPDIEYKYCVTYGKIISSQNDFMYFVGTWYPDQKGYVLLHPDSESVRVHPKEQGDKYQKRAHTCLRRIENLSTEDYQTFLIDFRRFINDHENQMHFKLFTGKKLCAKVPILYRNQTPYMPGTIFEVEKVVDYAKQLDFEGHNAIFESTGWDEGIRLVMQAIVNKKYQKVAIQVDLSVLYLLFDPMDEDGSVIRLNG